MKITLVLLSVLASAFADIGSNSHVKREHHVPAAIMKRNETSNLVKRESFTGIATYYDVTPNAGACGHWMSPGDHVIALNSPQLNAYGGYVNGKPSSCYRSVTITGRGKSAQATVMDECPTCGWGSIDLSEGLFTIFASTGDGIFEATWWFNDGSGQEQPQPTPEPTPDYTPPPSPQPETTTTTSSTTETTSTTPTSTSTSTTSTSSTSEETHSVQDTTTTPPPREPNVYVANDAVLKLAAFINAAAGL